MKRAATLDEAFEVIGSMSRVSEFMALVKLLWKEKNPTPASQPRPQSAKEPLDSNHFNWPPCAC